MRQARSSIRKIEGCENVSLAKHEFQKFTLSKMSLNICNFLFHRFSFLTAHLQVFFSPIKLDERSLT